MSELKELIKEHQKECEESIAAMPDGPWKHEVHRMEFKHAGLNCLIIRVSSLGHWCGYVAVPEGHHYYGIDYGDTNLLEVHGGLTYSGVCNDLVCHPADDDKHLWWFGFDCAHCYDLSPGMLSFREAYLPTLSGVLAENHTDFEKYRTIDYVLGETKSLADQLAGGIDG